MHQDVSKLPEWFESAAKVERHSRKDGMSGFRHFRLKENQRAGIRERRRRSWADNALQTGVGGVDYRLAQVLRGAPQNGLGHLTGDPAVA